MVRINRVRIGLTVETAQSASPISSDRKGPQMQSQSSQNLGGRAAETLRGKDEPMSMHRRSEHIELCTLAESQLSSAKPKPTDLSRDTAIDFTKGALVLFMVLYHWLNYFFGPQGQYYDYLRFLTPSFIFITGFMISQIQLRRYEHSGRSLAKRLFVRGLKLLAVFLVLNALAYAALSRVQVSYSLLGKSLRSLSWAAFVVGTSRAPDGQKSVIFNILVPIAYLLILSAMVVLTRRVRYAFYCTLSLLIAAVIFIRFSHSENMYLDLLMIGVLGVAVGFAGRDQLALVISHPYILTALYCLFLAAITIWGVPLPLEIASVILTTALLYSAGSRLATPGTARRRMILLGKYSLLGYIGQIAILQGLRRISWLSQHGVGASLAALLLGVLLTVAVVEAVDFARQRSKIANDLYRLVFA
jgi:peptidoglycan/LPS O-acetylase OafA/YrhL